mgnify:FL=1
MNLDTLNEQQKEAVTTVNGPLLVLAGAGSGKTRVLTTRVAYLLEEVGIAPEQILAITFTNKAAKEMKERIIQMLGPIGYQIQISTFHSFGLLILRENYEKLNYAKNFTILDSDDTLTVIKKIMKDMGLDPKEYNPRAIKNRISGAKNELLSPMEYERFAQTDFEEKVVKIYEKYEQKLKQNDSVDFDDLLMLPIQLFQKFPEILKSYQERFQYILVDEYQDTNEAQYILIKMISAKYRNICVVGDNDQSIYSFRGANYRNILNFEKDYKNPKVIMLEENYRSTKTILNAANDVIQNNKQRKDKNLWTNNEDGVKIRYHRALDEKDEANYVMKEIVHLIENHIKPEDIAILYRTNAQSRNMEDVLLRENIPYKVVGSFYFYNRKEIKDLISYMKLIYNQHDDVSLLRIINSPKRGIGAKTIENLTEKANEQGKSIFEVIDSGKELAFKHMIEDLIIREQNLSLTELVEEILIKSGMKQELVNEKSMEADIRLENLEEFKTITKSFEENNGIVSLEEFLMEISLVSDVEEHKNNNHVVTLMTVHSAKGLEFDYVFLIGMEEGIFPHNNSFMNPEDLEEERRLCYVAITRAKKSLWLVNARRRTIYGMESQNPPSRFIDEIDASYLDKDIEEKKELFRFFPKKETLVDKNAEYQIGDHIIHNQFGEGVVVGVDKSILTIAFPHPHGIKKLLKGHKSIQKKGV